MAATERPLGRGGRATAQHISGESTMSDVSPYLQRPVRPWYRAFYDLYLAARGDKPPEQHPRPAAARALEAGQRRILVVDDDEGVRTLVATILTDVSFEV